MKKNLKIAGLIILLLLILLISVLSLPEYTNNKETSLHLQPGVYCNLQWHEGWSLGSSCYYDISGNIFNTGTEEPNDVFLLLTLFDTDTETIRDSKEFAIGHIEKGETKNFHTELWGDCGMNYTITYSLNNQSET